MSERHKAAAAKRGAKRTSDMEWAVRDTMQTITDEIKANEGVYPHNGGAVSIAEVARRAGINESSFYKKGEQNFQLKYEVSLWLETLKKKETIGRGNVRKTFQERAKGWKQKYDDLQNRHILTELQLQQLQAEHEKLQQDYDALLEQMRKTGQNKVVPFPKGKS